MGLLRRHGHHEDAVGPATATSPVKQSLAPTPGTTEEYQQRIRAQMEQELAQQRAKLQQGQGG